MTTNQQGGGGSWSSLMNLKATSSTSTAASTGGSLATQPIKKIANAGEAFEKYKMKLQEKNERVSLSHRSSSAIF